ncbi:MAG: hypothetical protein ACTSXZ_04690 [Alphaproteobacteria bacterium]
MGDIEERKPFFDEPRNILTVLRGFYVVCALLLLIDILYHRHVIHAWESLFGFYALFGFVACVVLVLVAKEMRKVLMRDQDYYEDGR